MAYEDTALHPNRQVGRDRGDGDSGDLWWMHLNDPPPPNSDPHQATISAALPADVAAPADTEGYHPWGPLHWLIGDYRPNEED